MTNTPQKAVSDLVRGADEEIKLLESELYHHVGLSKSERIIRKEGDNRKMRISKYHKRVFIIFS